MSVRVADTSGHNDDRQMGIGTVVDMLISTHGDAAE
jgi:hypothetical protein